MLLLRPNMGMEMMEYRNDKQPKALSNSIDLFCGNLIQISAVACCAETQNEQKRFCVTAALGFDWSHVLRQWVVHVGQTREKENHL